MAAKLRARRWMAGSAACAASFVLACSESPGPAPAHLALSADAFGSAGVGSTVDRTITVTNDGGETTGVLTIEISGGDASEFTPLGAGTIPGRCEIGVTTLAGGASCELPVRWTVGGRGARSTILTVSATPGGSAWVALSGSGAVTITVVKSGTGTVTSVPAGIDCGATCEALFDADSVTLRARTANGSGHRFSHWSGACSGSARDCVLSTATDSSMNVSAAFVPIVNNLVFLSSVALPMNLGGVAAYDARCNELAGAAGINNATSDAYMAWVSSSTSGATSRIGAARSFVRTDGMPIGDQLSDLLASTGNRILNPISLDENGVDPGTQQAVLTGTGSDGSISPLTCADYTSASSSDYFMFGESMGGPHWWTHDNVFDCSRTARVYCFMKTQSTLLVYVVNPGKKIWVTNTAYVPDSAAGDMNPDQKCESEKPAGVAIAKALVATTTAPASAALDPAQTYVRPDGQVVGTYAELVAAGDLRSGPWQQADGVYFAGRLWTGANGPLTSTALTGTTCSDWTSSGVTEVGNMGMSGYASSYWWSAGQASCGDTGVRLLCVEQ